LGDVQREIEGVGSEEGLSSYPVRVWGLAVRENLEIRSMQMQIKPHQSEIFGI